MPFGNPIIAASLLDYDAGDESEYGGDDSVLLEYMMDRIVSFKFSDHERKKDQLEMVFRNDDYAMLDKPVFVKGQKIQVIWGWYGNVAPPRRMIVQKVEGGAEIVVTCQCPLTLLDKKKRSRFMEGATHSEFVRMIADEYGYRGNMAHIEDTETRSDITQARWMTDARMCKRLAKKNGFEFYIDASGLNWHKRKTERTPVRNFIHRVDPRLGDLLEPPEFDANLTKGVSRVRVLARDPILKTPVDVSVGISDEQDVSLGSDDELFDTEDTDIGLRGARISEEEVVVGGSITEEEAKSIASGMFRDTAKKRYKCKLKIIGDTRIGAKMIIGLYGVSETFDGLYYIKEAVTEIASGKYTITLETEKDALGKVKAAKKRGKRNNKNKDGKTPDNEKEDEAEYQMALTAMFNDAGEFIPAWIYTNDAGKTGQTQRLTEAEFIALSPKQQKALYDRGVDTYPDR